MQQHLCISIDVDGHQNMSLSYRMTHMLETTLSAGTQMNIYNPTSFCLNSR